MRLFLRVWGGLVTLSGVWGVVRFLSGLPDTPYSLNSPLFYVSEILAGIGILLLARWGRYLFLLNCTIFTIWHGLAWIRGVLGTASNPRIIPIYLVNTFSGGMFLVLFFLPGVKRIFEKP